MAAYGAPREFAVTPPRMDPRLAVLLLVAIPELVAFVAIFTMLRQPHRVPVSLATSIDVHRLIAFPIAIIFLAVGAMLFWAVQRRRIVFADGMLDVTATLYRRKQAAAAFDLDAARIVNLDEHKEWRPFLKSNGLGVAGLRAGWFRSRSFVKLFCLLTARDRVLILPERTGGATLLSVEQPQQLLDALRAAADASRGNR